MEEIFRPILFGSRFVHYKKTFEDNFNAIATLHEVPRYKLS
jgi:hypothetical protein